LEANALGNMYDHRKEAHHDEECHSDVDEDQFTEIKSSASCHMS
jgi:hypothetical protein